MDVEVDVDMDCHLRYCWWHRSSRGTGFDICAK